jgi:hypothetical protein
MTQPICENCECLKTWPELKQTFKGDNLHLTCKVQCVTKNPAPPKLTIPELFKSKYGLEFSNLVRNPQQYKDGTIWYSYPDDKTTLYGWNAMVNIWVTKEYDTKFINPFGI